MNESYNPDDATLISWKDLDDETLTRLLSEIVTRDGTDYGQVEKSTEQKIASARLSLERGKSQLFWNTESETAALLSADAVREIDQQYQSDRKKSGITRES